MTTFSPDRSKFSFWVFLHLSCDSGFGLERAIPGILPLRWAHASKKCRCAINAFSNSTTPSMVNTSRVLQVLTWPPLVHFMEWISVNGELYHQVPILTECSVLVVIIFIMNHFENYISWWISYMRLRKYWHYFFYYWWEDCLRSVNTRKTENHLVLLEQNIKHVWLVYIVRITDVLRSLGLLFVTPVTWSMWLPLQTISENKPYPISC